VARFANARRHRLFSLKHYAQVFLLVGRAKTRTIALDSKVAEALQTFRANCPQSK
jgi:capsule polysaccharide modification protein KpsS